MSRTPTSGGGAADNAPHAVRLRQPWQSEPADTSDSQSVAYTRRFGAPSNLSADEHVDLVVAGVEGLVAVWLNGNPLEVDTSADHVRVEITSKLARRNEVKLIINAQAQGTHSGPEPAVESWQARGAVRLEIGERR